MPPASSPLPAAPPASVIRNRRSSTIPTPNVVPRRSMAPATNPTPMAGAPMRAGRLSHRVSAAGHGASPKRTSISMTPSSLLDDPRSTSPGRSNAASRAIVPKMIELMEQPTYDLSNTRIDTKQEAMELEKDMAALRAAILRLERDVKDTFTTRRVVTAAQAYFPDIPTPSTSAMGSVAPSQSLLGGVGAASAAIGVGTGEIGMGGSSSGDDMILRAKAELANQKEKAATEAEDKIKTGEAHKRMIEEMIQATKKRFVENSNLNAAGPKHVHHFHGFLGDVMHIEIVGASLVIVFTSRGFIEIWRQESLTSWKLADYWHLAPHYPRVTSVAPLTPTPSELSHLMQNRIHYLKPPEELAPPKPETPPSPADMDESAAADEEEDDIAPLPPPAGLSSRSDPPPSSAAAAAAAAGGGGFPMLSGRRGVAPPPKDELVQMLTSATYDMGGNVAVSDEQAVRRANYFAFLLAWAGSRSAATSAASMLGAVATLSAAPTAAAVPVVAAGSKAGSAAALADPAPTAPIPMQPAPQQQQQVIDRQLFLIGCANGEVSLLELTIDFGALVSSSTDSPHPGAAFTSSAPARPVRFRILDRAMISVAPVLHSAYFAPGHHAVVVAHSRDATGHLVAELVGYALPRLKPAFRVPLMDLVTVAREMAEDPDGTGAPPPEDDPYSFGGGWNSAAHASAAALTVPASARGSGALGLTALVADNVQLRLYLGVRDLLVQVAFASLPLITEATFFNAEEGDDAAGGKRRASSMDASTDGVLATPKRGGGAGGGDDEMLELVVVAAHSVRARELDEDEASLGSELGSQPSLDGGERGAAGGLAGAVPEELVEISSLCPIASPYTFKPYLLLGCTDASIRCVPLDDPTQEIFYYSSDIALRGTGAPMAVAALTPFRDAQLAVAVCVDGTTSVLSMDRRQLLNEHRLLLARGGVRNAASAAAAVTSRVVRQPPPAGSGGGRAGGTPKVLPAIPLSIPLQDDDDHDNHEGHVAERSALASPAAPRTRAGAVAARRHVYVGDPEQCLYAVAAGNEWALVKVTELVKWLDANPAGVAVGVGTGPPLM